MSLPKPQPGLVIRYSYLWLREHRAGREEGVKDRPCAIVLAAHNEAGKIEVVVVPVTHSQPKAGVEALELPLPIKQMLGLDSERSWVVLAESNEFDWPGPDLRRIGDNDDSTIDYGMLPPRFFAELRTRYMALEDALRARRITRTE